MWAERRIFSTLNLAVRKVTTGPHSGYTHLPVAEHMFSDSNVSDVIGKRRPLDAGTHRNASCITSIWRRHYARSIYSFRSWRLQQYFPRKLRKHIHFQSMLGENKCHIILPTRETWSPVCVCVRARVCARACVCVCVRARVCVRVSVRLFPSAAGRHLATVRLLIPFPLRHFQQWP